MYISKVLKVLSNTILANSYLSINFIYLVIDKAFVTIYNLQINFFAFPNYMFVLLKKIKSFFVTIFISMSANKKVFLKNQIFLNIFQPEKLIITTL